MALVTVPMLSGGSRFPDLLPRQCYDSHRGQVAILILRGCSPWILFILSEMTSVVPLEDLLAWARLNYVDFGGTRVENVPGKGLGLFTTQSRLHEQQETKAGPLLEIPRDLILSAEAVEDYAKVNKNFRQLLDKVDPQVGHPPMSAGPWPIPLTLLYSYLGLRYCFTS